MYIPKHDEENNLETLRALIRAHPLGTWVTLGAGELVANHIPFYIDAERGPLGTLVGHVARANPVWQGFSTTLPSIIIFQGTETYITPSWYASKQEHGKVVPTWNYVVVHVQGIPRIFEDSARLFEYISHFTDEQEAGEPVPWRVSDAPQEYLDRLQRAIVGIEVPIDSLVGKWKVSRNKSEADREGVVAGLAGHGEARFQEMADLVREAGSQRAGR